MAPAFSAAPPVKVCAAIAVDTRHYAWMGGGASTAKKAAVAAAAAGGGEKGATNKVTPGKCSPRRHRTANLPHARLAPWSYGTVIV